MSLKDRKKAIDIVASAIVENYFDQNQNASITDFDRAVSSRVLNELLKAGYLNDKASVHASEIGDELDQAIFKCKVQE
jgi:hypothetical protein